MYDLTNSTPKYKQEQEGVHEGGQKDSEKRQGDFFSLELFFATNKACFDSWSVRAD